MGFQKDSERNCMLSNCRSAPVITGRAKMISGRPRWTIGLIVALTWMTSAYAGDALSEGERRGMRDLIVSEQGKMSSLFVKFRVITKTGDEEASEIPYEWAMSGVKRYRKRFWPGPVGGPVSTRWGLAVWDGKFKKAYDSALFNGSLRAEDNPAANEPSTFSPYAQNLGHLTHGTISDIFAKVPLEDWDAQWSDDKSSVTFTTEHIEIRNSPLRHSWTFDTTKGCMISRYECLLKGTEGQWDPYQVLTVLESKQVSPGIWLSMKSHVESIVRHPGEAVPVVADYIVDEIKVNDPSIEEVFHFEWPEKAQYYDFVIGATVIPHATPENTEKMLDAVAGQQVPRMASDANDISGSGASDANTVGDDFALAKNLAHDAGRSPLAVGGEREGDRSGMWRYTVVLVGVFGVFAAWLLIRRPRRG